MLDRGYPDKLEKYTKALRFNWSHWSVCYHIRFANGPQPLRLPIRIMKEFGRELLMSNIRVLLQPCKEAWKNLYGADFLPPEKIRDPSSLE